MEHAASVALSRVLNAQQGEATPPLGARPGKGVLAKAAASFFDERMLSKALLKIVEHLQGFVVQALLDEEACFIELGFELLDVHRRFDRGGLWRIWLFFVVAKRRVEERHGGLFDTRLEIIIKRVIERKEIAEIIVFRRRWRVFSRRRILRRWRT